MKLRTLFALVAVLALIATACAGDSTEAETTTTTSAEGGTTSSVAGEASTTTSEAPVETPTTSGGGSSGALASLQASLSRTRDATNGRMEGMISITGAADLPGETFSIPFSGAFDNDAGNFSFIMDMSFMAGSEEVPPEMAGMFGEMEMRTIGDTSYIRFPFFSIFLGTETEWIATPVEEGMDATGGLGGATPSNPADFLAYFEEANGTVEELGSETIRGVDTTHYLVIFDMEELLENATAEQRAEIEAQQLPLDRLPMDLWISDDGLVYKYRIEIDGAALDLTEDESFESMIMDFEMYDYGADIVIEAPPADEVTNMDEIELFEFGDV